MVGCMRQKRLLPTISIKYRKSLSYCASPFLSNKDVLSKKKYFRSKIQFLVVVGVINVATSESEPSLSSLIGC